MKVVQSWDDIFNNIMVLQKYRNSKENNEANYYKKLIKRGTCFLATKINEEIVFSPSRFIGYQNNSREKHDANKAKDGRVTNPEIEKITKSKFMVNEGLERAYQIFCLSLGFSPTNKGSFNVTRKYIAKDLPAIFSNDFLRDDLKNIDNQNDIPETEKIQLINARLGQGIFREALVAYWKGCSCTGCKELTMLRASHIKSWRLCNNEERLDPFNGLLLIPNLDLAFDNGLITFSGDGNLIISEALSVADSMLLGISKNLRVNILPKHESYMQYHRENIFRK